MKVVIDRRVASGEFVYDMVRENTTNVIYGAHRGDLNDFAPM